MKQIDIICDENDKTTLAFLDGRLLLKQDFVNIFQLHRNLLEKLGYKTTMYSSKENYINQKGFE